MDTLLQSLAEWKPFTAIVIGDFMLDKSVFGDAQRLSPDAPVPVLKVRRTEHRPGGAGNLCLDLAALKSKVLALGLTGDDEEGAMLRRRLEEGGVDASGLVADGDRPTTVKCSYIGLAQQRHAQKMFRVDHESDLPVSARIARDLMDRFRAALRGADVVCIEDYAKGLCTPEICRDVIALATQAGVPVFVDPAMVPDYSKYRGSTAITPNRSEAELATGLPTDADGGIPANAAVSARLLEQLGCEAVVLTLDRHGAMLHRRDSSPESVPTRARAVYDVTGAGDMMLAGLAAGRANGMSWTDAVRFANAAAGLEVEIFGVEPIPLERIHRDLLRELSPVAGKVRPLEVLVEEVATRRRGGQSIVVTNGCFDVLHSGHVHLIEQAAKLGDFLIVAINDDASVKRLKGEGRPVNSIEQRARVIGALEGVGAVVVFPEDTADRVLGALRPDVLVKGGDYPPEGIIERPLVEGYGGRVELVPPIEGVSTTRTIAKMKGSAS